MTSINRSLARNDKPSLHRIYRDKGCLATVGQLLLLMPLIFEYQMKYALFCYASKIQKNKWLTRLNMVVYIYHYIINQYLPLRHGTGTILVLGH